MENQKFNTDTYSRGKPTGTWKGNIEGILQLRGFDAKRARVLAAAKKRKVVYGKY